MAKQFDSKSIKTERLLISLMIGVYLVGGLLVGAFAGRWFDASIVWVDILATLLVLNLFAPLERH